MRILGNHGVIEVVLHTMVKRIGTLNVKGLGETVASGPCAHLEPIFDDLLRVGRDGELVWVGKISEQCTNAGEERFALFSGLGELGKGPVGERSVLGVHDVFI